MVDAINRKFSGRGKALVSESGSNVFRWLGDVADVALGMAVTVLKDKEMYSGLDRVESTIIRGGEVTATITLKSYSMKNLADVLHGTVADIEAGTATDEALPDDLVVGDIIGLAHQKVSDVVVKDSTPVTPATLVSGTDYRLNANHGSVEILKIATFTQPFKVSYSYAAAQAVGIFTRSAPVLRLRFEGLNTAGVNGAHEPVLLELWKLQINPAENLPLVQDAFGNFVLKGEAMIDESKPADNELGQIGALTYLA